MNFLTANIDRAIVMTQYDLRGFSWLGSRMEKNSAKDMDAITANFMAFAAGLGGDSRQPTDKKYANYFKTTYKEYLAMCKRLFKDCDLSQREAIQLIIQEIVKQNEEMKAEVAAGKRRTSPYLRPLDKDNCWGRAVLAMAEAFEVSLDKIAA